MKQRCVFALASLFIGAALPAAVEFNLSLFTADGFPGIDASRINDQGVFSCEWSTAPYLWQGAVGPVGAIGSLGPFAAGQNLIYSAATSGGAVVGCTTDDNLIPSSFYFDGSVNTEFALAGYHVAAYAINDAGQIVGFRYATSGNGSTHAFSYQGGVTTDLGALGGDWSEAYAVNAAGQVTGIAATASGAMHAFLYSDGAMQDLGAFSSGVSYARDLNRFGQVVGFSNVGDENGPAHAFVYRNGALEDLGTMGQMMSDASAINDAGIVVGSAMSYELDANDLPIWDRQAFLHRDGTMAALDGLVALSDGSQAGFLKLEDAIDINNSGVIVGTGQWTDGQGNVSLRSFVATPVAIPEPATVALWIGLGGVGVACWRRFGRRRIER